MATNDDTQAGTPGIGRMAERRAKASRSTDLNKLHIAIEEIDGLSQSGFSEIAAFARLALDSLERPDTYNRLDTIATALSAIWGKALDIENCINATAEQVGCHHVNDAQRRRWAAAAEARKQCEEARHA